MRSSWHLSPASVSATWSWDKGVSTMNEEPKLGSPPQAVDITIHYADGTRETVKQGMLTSLSPDGVINVLCLGITVDDFIKMMSALQGGIREIINGSNTGPQEPE